MPSLSKRVTCSEGLSSKAPDKFGAAGCGGMEQHRQSSREGGQGRHHRNQQHQGSQRCEGPSVSQTARGSELHESQLGRWPAVQAGRLKIAPQHTAPSEVATSCCAESEQQGFPVIGSRPIGMGALDAVLQCCQQPLHLPHIATTNPCCTACTSPVSLRMLPSWPFTGCARQQGSLSSKWPLLACGGAGCTARQRRWQC